ncbi:DUF6177 family protein [Pseudactinotalea sp.]|uniref:DUF6177 family protein n=1 Tax=Pseudactinotalea sp. TaxID=1926260 RepID=UPI003B3BC047
MGHGKLVNPIAEPLVIERCDAIEVVLDRELESFFATAADGDRQSALVTHPGARLSPFVDAELRRSETTWILRDDEGYHTDAVTGLRVGEIRFATGPRMVDSSSTPDHTMQGVVIEAVVRFRATASVRLGAVASRALAALDVEGLQHWGVAEPLDRAWSSDAVTSEARRAMPAAFLARASGAAHAWIGVRRTSRGLSESTRLLVPPGALAGTPEDAIELVTDVLTRQFQVELATFLRFPTSTSGWRLPGRVPPPTPIALVLGPRAVRGLSLPGTFAHGVESSFVGRQRLPSQLLRFTDRARAWQHLASIGLPPHPRPASPDQGLVG